MASLSYPKWLGGFVVTVLALGLPGASALMGGCNETTGGVGGEDKDGVNEVPSPSKSDGFGPGGGGLEGGGGSTGTGLPCSSDFECQDSSPCTIESCGPEKKCVQKLAADDSNACTTDTCDENTGAVSNVPKTLGDNTNCTFDSCDPAIGIQHQENVPVFAEDFTTNMAGWTLGPQWQIGNAAASQNAFQQGDDPPDDKSASGDGVAGTQIAGLVDVSIVMNGVKQPSFLTSPAIPVQTLDNGAQDFYTLRFFRWLNANDPNTATDPGAMNVGVQVISCGTAPDPNDPFSGYTTLWQNGKQVLDAPPAGIGYYEIRLDVTQAVKDCQSAGEDLRVRWYFVKESTANKMGGWNVDDVQIQHSKVKVDNLICTVDSCDGDQPNANPVVPKLTSIMPCDDESGPSAPPM